MQKIPLSDKIFGKVAQATAKHWTRRSFISKAASASIFLLMLARKSVLAQSEPPPPPPPPP
jgi:hypothetical protein